MGFAVRKHHSNRIEIPGSLIGWTPAIAAAANEYGMVHIDSSIYEFQPPDGRPSTVVQVGNPLCP